MPCAHKSGLKKHSSSALFLALPYDSMVPLLVLCLLSPLLVASADPPALKCIQGYDATQAPTECSSDFDTCVTIKDEYTLTDPKFNATFYTCGRNFSCAHAFTITIGDGKHLRHTSACCTTDGCNANLKWGDSKSFVVKGCGTRNVGELYSLNGFINGNCYKMRTAIWKPAKSSSTNHILEKSSL
ncbi:uncharacterized protein LOC114602260 isoform X3 [Podarcis muralis]